MKFQEQQTNISNSHDYLKIGTARDIKDAKEKRIFRLFEMLPGAIAWGTLISVVMLSWLEPSLVSIFIIFFVFYWLFRTIYFSFLLRAGYKKMKEQKKVDWIKKIEKIQTIPAELQTTVKNWGDIFHLIVLPMYEEPYEIVRDTFQSLLNSDYPKNKMIVVLAIEERAEKEVEKTAEKIRKEFGNSFFKFLITKHPKNIKGEIAGKGSNETWAIKETKKLIIDNIKIPYKNIIVSSLDIDSVIFPKYFSCVTYHYLTAAKPTRTSYQPLPLFINNIWDVPSLSRIFSFSSTFWHTMNQERPEKLITFSSHSMSFKALYEVGFRQTNVVSDDSRIFWQCFLKYDGDYRTQPLYYPISMDANIAKNFWRTMKNIYKQQRRWAYGVIDIPYFLFGFLKNKKIPLRKKIPIGIELIEGHWSWACASLMIFSLGWLPLILGGSEFSQTVLSYNLPKITAQILTISMSGLIISAWPSILLLPRKPEKTSKYKYLIVALGWLLFPICAIIFTAFPALDAQTRLMFGKYMGFWPTEKVRK